MTVQKKNSICFQLFNFRFSQLFVNFFLFPIYLSFHAFSYLFIIYPKHLHFIHLFSHPFALFSYIFILHPILSPLLLFIHYFTLSHIYSSFHPFSYLFIISPFLIFIHYFTLSPIYLSFHLSPIYSSFHPFSYLFIISPFLLFIYHFTLSPIYSLFHPFSYLFTLTFYPFS